MFFPRKGNMHMVPWYSTSYQPRFRTGNEGSWYLSITLYLWDTRRSACERLWRGVAVRLWGRTEAGCYRCIESQKAADTGGRERTFRFLQISQALQTLARMTLAGL